MARITIKQSLINIFKKRTFWIIVLLFVLITIVHYQEFEQPSFISDFLTKLGLTRHAFDRIMYLAPITLAGYAFGWIGGVASSFIALVAMLPRALLISSYTVDSLFECFGVFFIGNILAMTFNSLRKEKEYRLQCEEAQEKLRLYLGMVNKAQEDERKRISHELHDDTIQSLIVLSRHLERLSKRGVGISDENRTQLEQLRQNANNIVVEIRRLSQDLRPSMLDQLGLVPAIEWFVNDISQFSGIDIKLSVTGEIPKLDKDKELVVFRIIQEAIRNVINHSKATQAEVWVFSDSNILDISIIDYGRGFQVTQKVNDLPSEGKLEMVGMYERAKLIGATLAVTSGPGGTTVKLRISVK